MTDKEIVKYILNFLDWYERNADEMSWYCYYAYVVKANQVFEVKKFEYDTIVNTMEQINSVPNQIVTFDSDHFTQKESLEWLRDYLKTINTEIRKFDFSIEEVQFSLIIYFVAGAINMAQRLGVTYDGLVKFANKAIDDANEKIKKNQAEAEQDEEEEEEADEEEADEEETDEEEEEEPETKKPDKKRWMLKRRAADTSDDEEEEEEPKTTKKRLLRKSSKGNSKVDLSKFDSAYDDIDSEFETKKWDVDYDRLSASIVKECKKIINDVESEKINFDQAGKQIIAFSLKLIKQLNYKFEDFSDWYKKAKEQNE